jgi:tetratricopeptide (TPR) repeat protein
MSLRLIALLLLALPVVRARAAEPLAAPAPLAAAAAPAPGERMLELRRARQMLELGFPSVAAGVFEKLLAASDVPAAERDALVLDLVSARLNQGDTAAAAQALQTYAGPRGAAWHLRAGLVAARQTGPDAVRTAQAELATAQARLAELPAGERAWVYFLQGRLADAAGDSAKSLDAYRRAMDAAGSDLQRARFDVAFELARLNAKDVSEDKAKESLASAQRYAGTATGYTYARLYAVEMFALGHKAEAAAYLQSQLSALPAAERDRRADFRLLLGLVAGAQDGTGRDALEKLLTDADNRDHQRAALQLLANASAAGPAREELLLRLDALIKATPAHPVLADMLLVRAQLADKAGTAVEDDAKKLLTLYPGSKLVPAAWGTLLGAAWEKRQFRAAADYADKARAALSAEDGGPHAELGVLKAEAWFRAGETGDANDFKNAAAAYAEALADPPAGVAPGTLIFQQAQSLIRAGARDAAGKLLDRLAGDPRLDAASRWQAEWNLARAYQAAGSPADAYARVNALLGTSSAAGAELAGGLRARMAWLQVELALDADTPERAITLAQALAEALPRMAGLEEKLSGGVTLRDEVSASARLLEARASFALKTTPGDEQALALLEALRTGPQFQGTDTALRSYLEAADFFASPGRDQIVKAQDLLQQLADKFQDDKSDKSAALFYAPAALYQKALLEERRGQEENFDNAFKVLDQLLFKYPGSDMEFAARLKQGELLRRLNKFPEAQQIYQLLVDQFAQDSHANEAKLALADCDYAQVAGDASHYERARRYYTELQYLTQAAPDLRAEAGFKHGMVLSEHGEKNEAAEVWLAHALAFLPEDPAKATLGADGRYWISRGLIRCGELLEAAGRLEEARNAYSLVVARGLPFAALARAALGRLGGAAVP